MALQTLIVVCIYNSLYGNILFHVTLFVITNTGLIMSRMLKSM